MSNVDYNFSVVNDVDISVFDEYDIISGNEFPACSEIKSQNHDGPKSEHSLDDLLSSESLLAMLPAEWDELFLNNLNIDEMKKKSVNGELQSNHFRSICWRCMLGILHSEPNQWLMELKTHRSHYNNLWVELKKNPWNVEKSPSDNPLSQEAESIWQKYFSNEELKSVIHQDVVRTFPGVKFFRKETVQDLMVRILFCYARQNPSLCYRQGMHEILAPLIFVLQCDHQTLLQAKKQSYVKKEILDILDPKYLEEDAYSMFKHIMNNIECSYRIKNMVPTSTGHFSREQSFCNVETDKTCENEVINRLQYIKDNILQSSDPDLNKHLDELDIPLHLFGIRWLRLLFGREFKFQDLLILWDAIFAINNFELVDYIVVSMLTAIRPILIVADYVTCLTNLMNYPPDVDVMFVIKYALHLMEPSQYPVPTVTSFSDKPITLVQMSKSKTVSLISHNKISTPKHTERLKIFKPKTTKWLPGKPHSQISRSGGGDGPIIEGFPVDDPKVLRAELDDLKLTIQFIEKKLSQCYTMLNDHLTEPFTCEVKLALDGICEVCSILKAYQAPTEIEQAFEAHETRQTTPTDKKNVYRPKPETLDGYENLHSNTSKAMKKFPDGELKVFKKTQVQAIIGAPMTDPLRLMKRVSCGDLDD